MLKMIGLRSIVISPAGIPSSAIRPPCAMLASIPRSASALPDISSADVEALRHPELALDLVELRSRGSTPRVAPIRQRELEPVGVRVGDDDVPRAGVAHDGDRHAADRARARDEHVLAEHGERERRVHGVPERVEDRRHLLVDPGPVVPDVRHRQRRRSSANAPGPLHAEPDRVGAQVAPAGHAVAAAAADDVPLAADDVAGAEVAHVRADLDDLADELVPDHERHGNRLLRPRVPLVDVEVGAADPGLAHPDQDVVDPDLRLGHVLEPEPRLGLGFDERPHSADLTEPAGPVPADRRECPAMDEGTMLLLVGAVLAASIAVGLGASRAGVPALVAFLALGMLLGSDGPGGIAFDDAELARKVGVVCLVAILYEGGLSTSWRRLRNVAVPASLLSTVGVLVTALLTGAAAHTVFDLDWPQSILLGGVVASTDAAAVFATLRHTQVRRRLARTLECETGLNDPIAIAFTLGLIHWIDDPTFRLDDVLFLMVKQLGIGLVVGVVLGFVATRVFSRLSRSVGSFAPVASVAAAALSFGVADVLGGSGFLAVYLVGLAVGSTPSRYRGQLVHFHEDLAFLAQVTMFVVLGLLVFPSDLPAVMVAGFVLALLLVFVIRPAAVVVSTAFSDFTTGSAPSLAGPGSAAPSRSCSGRSSSPSTWPRARRSSTPSSSSCSSRRSCRGRRSSASRARSDCSSRTQRR